MKKIFTLYSLLFTLCVSCNGGSEITQQRNGVHPPTASSRAVATRVVEFLPAPGQFVGEADMMGFTGAETTQTAANSYAEERLKAGKFISLGGFGGYIIVAFDHSVEAWGKPTGDFTVVGNQFDGNSEPGIVWVMSDDNGDGIPNETWYELRGAYPTTKGYEVTYFSSDDAVQWIDNQGHSGTIERVAQHTQTSYYPQWITDESYTLTGSLLDSRAFTEPSGKFNTGNYGWGFADNFGSDTGLGGRTRFFISNAVRADGTPAELKAIDFVRIQTGVNVQGGGGIGELSTELCEICDENL